MTGAWMSRVTAAAFFAACVAFRLSPVAASADELVMFEQAGCPYCALWNHDVGAAYAKTQEGKALPLRRVDIHAHRPAGLEKIDGVRFTPTFVVMHCGVEYRRITGYGGNEQFWGLLDEAERSLQAEPNTGNGACMKRPVP
ncbi:MAG: hypothetical protein NVS3B16_06730 [Vulcanimicrobiaceae bacterium]